MLDPAPSLPTDTSVGPYSPAEECRHAIAMARTNAERLAREYKQRSLDDRQEYIKTENQDYHAESWIAARKAWKWAEIAASLNKALEDCHKKDHEFHESAVGP